MMRCTRESRGIRRHFEHLCWRTKLEIHRQLYVQARNDVTACVAKLKINFDPDNPDKADNESTFRLVRSLGGQQMMFTRSLRTS